MPCRFCSSAVSIAIYLSCPQRVPNTKRFFTGLRYPESWLWALFKTLRFALESDTGKGWQRRWETHTSRWHVIALAPFRVAQTERRIGRRMDFTEITKMGQSRSNGQAFTVYYDGACPLCSKEIDTYRKVNGAENLAWVDASQGDRAQLGEDLNPQEALARMHVRDESGQLISGAAAFAAIWSRLPKTRWLGRLMGTQPALWILEPGYRLFLKVRPLWRKS